MTYCPLQLLVFFGLLARCCSRYSHNLCTFPRAMGTSTTWPTAYMRPRSRKSWTIAAASRSSWTGKQRAQEWIILRVFHFALDLVSCAWRTKWTCGATKIGGWTGWSIINSSSNCFNHFWPAFFEPFWPFIAKGEKSCDRDSWHVLQLLRTPGGQDQEHISLIFRDLTAISPWTHDTFIRKKSCSWPVPPCPTSIFCPGEIDL